MNNPSISRFTSATASSLPVEAPFTAPAVQGDAAFDFLTILNTLAEHRTESGADYYHSLSLWDDGHASWEHNGTTCLHLAYTVDTAPMVSDILQEVDLFHYQIPIKDKRKKVVLFAFPSIDHFDHTETTRAASLMAHAIGIKGVVKNTYLSTYFFRFQSGAVVEQHGQTLIGRNLIDDHATVFVRMKEYLA